METKLPSSLLHFSLAASDVGNFTLTSDRGAKNEAGSLWPVSCFILHRNLAQFPFPHKMSDMELKQALFKMREALIGTSTLKNPLFLKAEELSPTDKEFLFEHFFRLDPFHDTLKGQGFIVDESSCFLATLNIQDHLQLQMIDCQGEWEETWNRLSHLETTLSSFLNYAYSPKFGYLTADPASCGTGLTVLVYLHLPALIHTGQIEEALLKQKEEDILATGVQGIQEDHKETFVGNLLVLSNRYTLGLSEENILRSLHNSAMKLILSEKTIRTHLKQTDHRLIKDQISRAYGLLLHSYQLDVKEALGALSLLELGLDLGWISGISLPKLRELFFKCRRAHLMHCFPGELIEQHDLPLKRAEFLHRELQTLKIHS